MRKQKKVAPINGVKYRHEESGMMFDLTEPAQLEAFKNNSDWACMDKAREREIMQRRKAQDRGTIEEDVILTGDE